jgi:hypothetical protein
MVAATMLFGPVLTNGAGVRFPAAPQLLAGREQSKINLSKRH